MNTRALASWLALPLSMAFIVGARGQAAAPACCTVGGHVDGLNGVGLVLSDNGGDFLVVADSPFTFKTSLKPGDKYLVAVANQPVSNPQQTCTIANEHGMIGAANITNVTVTCTTGVAQKGTTFPSSGSTLGPGDKLVARECIPEFTLPPGGTAKYAMPSTNWWSPNTTTFWVDSHPDATGAIAGHFVVTPTSHFYSLWNLLHFRDGNTDTLTVPSCNFSPAPPSVDKLRQYYVNANTLDSYATQMAGVVYGALTIPYKYHFSGSALSAAPTLAAFVGAHVANPGVDVAWIVAGGLGSVSVPSTTNGQSSTDLKTSMSLSTGPVITLSKGQRFQIGLLMGADWTGNSAPTYPYNGKLWVALSLGVALTN